VKQFSKACNSICRAGVTRLRVLFLLFDLHVLLRLKWYRVIHVRSYESCYMYPKGTKPMCSSSFGGNLRARHTAYREEVCLAFLVKNAVMWKGKCLVLSCVAAQE